MTTPAGIPWQHLIKFKDKHIVYPNFPETLTDNSYDELTDQLLEPKPRNLPHSQDESWAFYLRSFFASPWFKEEFRLKEDENLPTYTQRLLEQKDFLVPTTLVVSRQHRQGIAHRLALTTHTAHLFATSLEELDEKFSEEFDQETEKVTQAEKENRRLRDEIIILQRKLSDCERREAHADELVAANQALIFEWENLGLLLKPGDQTKPPSFSVPASPQESHEILLKLIKYANEKRQGDLDRKPGDTMAAETPPRGNRLSILLPAQSYEDFWAQTPGFLKEGKRMPHTEEEIRDFIVSAIQNPTIQPPTSCQHPRELAIELGDPMGTQSWENSLGIVRDLLANQGQNPAPLMTSTPSRLFKATEVPKFKDTSKYEEFRTTLQAFFQSEDEPDFSEYVRAMRRVLSTFESPVARQAAAGWDPTPLVRPTWTATWEAFLAALDAKFQSATIHEDTIKEYMMVRPKDGETAADFFNRFDAVTNKLQEVQTRCGVPAAARFNAPTVTARLLQILPRYLVDNVRYNLARTGTILETQTIAQLRPEFERAWAYVPAPPKTLKSHTPAARTRNAPAITQNNQVTQRRCGMVVSYDSSPAVPHELRGGLYPSPRNTPEQNAQNAARRRAAAARAVCEYCRRPRSEHHASGPNFKQVTAADPPRTRVTPAAITGPRVEDVTDAPDQLLLPPPENPAT